MSDDRSKVGDKAGEIARNIWLAGVGAYGRAVDEAQGRLEKAGVETPKLFRDLVKAGAALEEEARSALSASQEARQSVEERIGRVRENFRLQRPGQGDDLQALHEKIDRLSARVEALTAALEGGAAPAKAKTKAKAKAAPRKKKAAAKTAKDAKAAKKAPARKAPARKKTAAKKRPAARKKAPAGKAGKTGKAATQRGVRGG